MADNSRAISAALGGGGHINFVIVSSLFNIGLSNKDICSRSSDFKVLIESVKSPRVSRSVCKGHKVIQSPFSLPSFVSLKEEFTVLSAGNSVVFSLGNSSACSLLSFSYLI